MSEQWQEDVSRIADNFDREGQALITFASSLRGAIMELNQDTCWSIVAAFLERLVGERVKDAQR